MLSLLTHTPGYAPDRWEAGSFNRQREAAALRPRQISLKTLMIITTLLCGAAGVASNLLRAAQQEQVMKQSK